MGLVANIAANLIAFLAVLEFINATLRWFGEMVDIEGLTFQVSPGADPWSGLPDPASPTHSHLCPLPQWAAETLAGFLASAGSGCPIRGLCRRSALSHSLLGCFSQVICSYVLMPVAFLMGADWADSPLVAELLGIKIFLNEFVAYQQLATYKKNRLMGLDEWDGNRKQWISVRDTSHPARHRAGMEPAGMGHGTWLGRRGVGRQRIIEPFSLEKSSKIIESG